MPFRVGSWPYLQILDRREKAEYILAFLRVSDEEKTGFITLTPGPDSASPDDPTSKV
jgi:hypothetical protein